MTETNKMRTLQIEGRCQKLQSQHLQVLQVPPAKDLNDSSGDFDDDHFIIYLKFSSAMIFLDILMILMTVATLMMIILMSLKFSI